MRRRRQDDATVKRSPTASDGSWAHSHLLSPHRSARVRSLETRNMGRSESLRSFEDIVICLVVSKLPPVKSMAWADLEEQVAAANSSGLAATSP